MRAQTRTRVDPNQEMVGLGAANLAAGLLPGLPDQQQLVAHAGRRGRGCPDAADRRRRRARDRAAAGRGAEPAAGPAQTRARRGRHRGRDRPVRVRRPAPDLPHPALGVLALDGLLRRALRVFGAIPGIGIAIVIAVIEFLWDGWRPHSAVLGRADGVKGYHDITRYPRGAAASPAWSCSAGMRRLFFANAELFQRPRARRGGGIAHAGALGRRRRRARHQRRRHRRGHRSPSSTTR